MGNPSRDSRDERTWATFELTRQGEKAAVTGELQKYIMELFSITPSQIFIPYKVCVCDGRTTVFNALEGYCFVEYCLEAAEHIHAIIDSPFLKSVLHSRSGYIQTLHTLPDARIKEIQRELNQMSSALVAPGDKVRITSGTFAGLEGDVLEVFAESVCLHIQLRSLKAIRVLPKFAITPGESNE